MRVMAPSDIDIVIDNLEEGILFLDKERHVVTINKAALKMIGQKKTSTSEKILLTNSALTCFREPPAPRTAKKVASAQ